MRLHVHARLQLLNSVREQGSRWHTWQWDLKTFALLLPLWPSHTIYLYRYTGYSNYSQVLSDGYQNKLTRLGIGKSADGQATTYRPAFDCLNVTLLRLYPFLSKQCRRSISVCHVSATTPYLFLCSSRSFNLVSRPRARNAHRILCFFILAAYISFSWVLRSTNQQMQLPRAHSTRLIIESSKPEQANRAASASCQKIMNNGANTTGRHANAGAGIADLNAWAKHFGWHGTWW